MAQNTPGEARGEPDTSRGPLLALAGVTFLFAVALWYSYQPATRTVTPVRQQTPCENAVWARAVAAEVAAGQRMVRELEDERRMMDGDPARGRYASERRELKRKIEALAREERRVAMLAACG